MMTTNKNRFFVDCHVFDKGFQGTRTYIQYLYLELIKDNDKQFFFAAKDVENLRCVFGNAPNIHYLRYRSHHALIRLLFEIPWLIWKNKINFAHFQYRVPPLKLCNYIVTIHDVLFEDFPEYFPKLNRHQSYWTYKLSAKYSDIVFTVSEYSKMQILKHLNVKRVIVMPNGVDNIFFEEYDKKEILDGIARDYKIGNYLIYVSRWEPRKSHDKLLRHYVNLKLYDDYQLVFIGEDTFKNQAFEDYYNKLPEPIRKNIIRFKRLDFSSMLMFLRGATAAVYPSIAEGFGIPPLESVAAKIPTITSGATAMSDFKFFNEYVFDPLNESDFEEKLSMVMTNGDPALELKRSVIRENYNWVKAAKIFDDALKNQQGNY